MITFLFASKRGFAPGASLIQWFQDLEFSHVAILVDEYVYESVFPVSRKVHKSEWRKHYQLKFKHDFTLKEGELEAVKLTLEKSIGIKYSILQLGLIFIGQVLSPIEGYLERRVWNGRKGLICSELMGEVLKAEPFNYDFKEKTDLIDLADVYVAVQELKGKKNG